MGVRGTKPAPDGPKRFRGAPTHDWTEVPNSRYPGKVPVRLPATRLLGDEHVRLMPATKGWWTAVRRMPHCRLWSETDWHYALMTALIADLAFRGSTTAATELRQREKVLGTTVDARRDLRIRYVDPKNPKTSTSKTNGSAAKSRTKKGAKGAKASVTSLEERRSRVTGAS